MIKHGLNGITTVGVRVGYLPAVVRMYFTLILLGRVEDSNPAELELFCRIRPLVCTENCNIMLNQVFFWLI